MKYFGIELQDFIKKKKIDFTQLDDLTLDSAMNIAQWSEQLLHNMRLQLRDEG